MKRLVLLGGGHAHIEVLRDLAARPAEGVAVTLVTPAPRLIYSGMVPGVIAGHYTLEEATIDLAALAQRAGADFHQTAASLVDPAAREVSCADASVVAYDVLSLDVGSVAAAPGVSGLARHAVPVRPLERLLIGWGDVLARARAGRVSSVSLVGGGAAGVELALAMEHRFRREAVSPLPHVRVITDAPDIVPEFSAGARRRLRRRLAMRNIGTHVAGAVVEIGPAHVRLDTGIEFASDATFWAAGAVAHEWIRLSGFATDKSGFLLVNDVLQSVTYRDVFGAGDCVTREGRALPKAGVFAVRAGPILAANLRAALAGQPLQRFATGSRYLALVSTGERRAVGTWNGGSWQGRWAWRWKDRIDRRFVALYSAPAPGEPR